MKKRIYLAIVIAAIAALSIIALTACETNQPDDGSVSDAPVTAQEDAPISDNRPSEPNSINEGDFSSPDPTNEDREFALLYNGFLIEMDINIEYVLTALGEPRGIFEAPSCAFDGTDRVFDYPSINLHTYPIGDEDFVHTIRLRDDGIRTTEGVRIGASLQDVINTYGEDFERDANFYRFTRGLTTLEFFVEDDVVGEISYGYIIEP